MITYSNLWDGKWNHMERDEKIEALRDTLQELIEELRSSHVIN